MPKINIQRKLTPKAKQYYCDNVLIGSSRYTYNILMNKISIFSDDASIITISPSSIFLWLLHTILFICVFFDLLFSNKYKILENNKKIGYTSNKIWHPPYNIVLFNSLYEIRIHKDETFSLLKDGIQIALYHKDFLTLDEKNTYQIYYCKEEPLKVIELLCLFIDMLFFDNNGTSFAWKKKEKIIVFHDKYQACADWRPDS